MKNDKKCYYAPDSKVINFEMSRMICASQFTNSVWIESFGVLGTSYGEEDFN